MRDTTRSVSRSLPALLAATALIAGACSDDGTSAPVDTSVEDDLRTSDDPARDGATARTSTSNRSDGRDDDDAAGGGGRFARLLVPFADCSAFLDHVKAEARERVGPYGLDNNGWWYGDIAVEEPAAEEAAAEEPAAEPASDSTGAQASGDTNGYTDTNVQEVGVDEPDLIKTDGDRILIVRDNRLVYVDISTGSPVVTDSITLPEGWGHELFFAGDRAVLFTNGGSYSEMPMPVDATADAEASFAEPAEDVTIDPGFWSPAALIVDVDISDPTDLRVDATLRIEGQYLSARRIDDTIRLAVSTGPQQLPWVYPQSEAGEERAERTNRELIDETTLDDWIPGFQLDVNGEVVAGGPLLGCGGLHHPDQFSGFDVISVLDIDMTSGLANGVDTTRTVGVLAGGQTIYSSLDRFYVATTKWAQADDVRDDTVPIEWNEDFETELHAFAISAGEPARYVASGSVSGSLLNQFSLDEHDGYVRVVTTDGSPWGGGDDSDTSLTVLAESDGQLVPVGQVSGLGRGERLYAARLLDDVGFAVTFRQVDPFYVIDLSDPTEPRLAGELKIPGYSSYLHPVAEGLVLGVGQDATDEGQVRGLKVSLFDVSDPANPRETAVWTAPSANSVAEYDHRAFQMWGSIVILPVQDWAGDFSGVVLLDISDGIREVGRISHTPHDGAPSSDCRALTVDDFTDETELFWMAQDGYAHLQLCGSDDTGGWGDDSCDIIPIGDLRYWGDPEAMDATIERLGAGDGDRVEICWPQGDYQQAIERSLVADGVLYTLAYRTLQANDLDDLALVGLAEL